MENILREVLLDHVKSPKNRGEIENATVSANSNNPVCGDVVKVDLLIENGFIKFSSDKEAKKYIVPPNKIVDFQSRNDIYSSGKYWIGKGPKSIGFFSKIFKKFIFSKK